MLDRTAGLTAAAQHAKAFLNALDERSVAARVEAAGVQWPTFQIPTDANFHTRHGPESCVLITETPLLELIGPRFGLTRRT